MWSSTEDVELRFCFALKKAEITGCLFADGKDPQRRLDHRSPILGDTSPSGLWLHIPAHLLDLST